jgi:O-antigen/teichoic acid export membrane protein
MHANIGPFPDDGAPIERPSERLISIPYLLLRTSSAGGAFVMGFIQTFVFARILTPDRFSIFIVVGAIGYTLWLTDLGLAKILFVNLRAGHLNGRPDEHAARQATAVILFYALLGFAAALVCFAVRVAQPATGWRDAAELALFLLYITLNLAWFSLRTVSISVDLFVFYEKLELGRRAIVIAAMLAMLAGLPLIDFLIGANLLWALLIVFATRRLVRRKAMVARLHGFSHDLVSFFRMNWHSIARSGISALSGVFVATFPYYFVPVMYGLGSAPIILEVTMRIFRGSSVIYAAATDLAVPGQTRALAARDTPRLIRTTLFATALCCIPAVAACGVLIWAGGPFFRFLLHGAANVPPAITPILVVLMLANVVQMVSESFLQHTGYFRSLALIGGAVAIMMITATGLAIVARFDIVGFLAAYATAFTIGALLNAIAAVCGPIRAAAAGADHNQSPLGLRAIRTAPPTQPAIPDRQDTARRIPQPSQNP